MIRAFSESAAGGRSSGISSGPGMANNSGSAGRVWLRSMISSDWNGNSGANTANSKRLQTAKALGLVEMIGVKAPPTLGSRQRAPNMLWGAHDNAPTSWGQGA